MAVSAFESWASDPELIDVPAGSWALTVRGRGDFDAAGYDREHRDLLGDADFEYRERIDRIGIAGCLSAPVAALLIVLPWTRPFWWAALVLLALAWGPHLLLRLTRRYRDIERRVRDLDRSYPNFVIELMPIDDEASVSGGHLVVQ
jgi:hypothetical protein